MPGNVLEYPCRTNEYLPVATENKRFLPYPRAAGGGKEGGAIRHAIAGERKKMNIFLTLASLFLIGSLLGWVFEVFFRKFFSGSNPEHKWINPGFLAGPYLPLYGFGITAMFLLCSIPMDFTDSAVLETVLRLILIAAVMTLIEYAAGLIFIKGMHVKLWDYSNRPGNVQGIICPLFTLIWGGLGALYLFLVHPHLINGLSWLADHLAYSFFVGLFYGIMLVDFCNSLQIGVKIRRFAADNQIVVRLEELKATIKKSNAAAKEKARFLFALRSERPLHENLRRYLEYTREREPKRRDRRQK